MRSMIFSAFAVLALAACDGDFLEPDVRTFNQVDRIGRPAINTVFIASGSKQDFNEAEPVNDVATYTADVVNFLTTVAGQSAGDAQGLAGALLPDILTIDVSTATGFLNGRDLSDDVITAELGLIFGSNAALNDDNVDANDVAFLSTFPYQAAPFVQ